MFTYGAVVSIRPFMIKVYNKKATKYYCKKTETSPSFIMVKRFILYVPQFSAVLIRCIYQLLVNKLLKINEDVLYLNDAA